MRTVDRPIPDKRLGTDAEIWERLHPPVRPDALPLEPPVATKLSLGKRAVDYVLGRPTAVKTEQDIQIRYKVRKNVTPVEKNQIETASEILQRLEEASNWKANDTIDDIVGELGPEELVAIIDSRNRFNEMDEESLAGHLINALKWKIAIDRVFGNETATGFPVADSYPGVHPAIRERALNYCVEFLKTRRAIIKSAKMQYGHGKSADQIIINW